MADMPELDIQMDPASLYREEIYTDRRIGTIRALVPVDGDGKIDASREVVYVGEAQIMTQVGPLPVSFEIEAKTLAEACEGFADGARMAFEETMKELQEMRRQQASSIVIPEAGAASALTGQGGLPPRGKIQIP